jgi:hypothetical protein
MDLAATRGCCVGKKLRSGTPHSHLPGLGLMQSCAHACRPRSFTLFLPALGAEIEKRGSVTCCCPISLSLSRCAKRAALFLADEPDQQTPVAEALRAWRRAMRCIVPALAFRTRSPGNQARESRTFVRCGGRDLVLERRSSHYLAMALSLRQSAALKVRRLL